MHFDKKSCVWTASPASSSTYANDNVKQSYSVEEEPLSTEELYRRFLRKRNWRSVSKDVLNQVYSHLLELEPLSKNDLKDTLMSAETLEATSTEVNKVLSILFKSHLLQSEGHTDNDQDERIIHVVDNPNYFHEIDLALLTRLVSSIQENNLEEDHNAIKNLLYDDYDDIGIEAVISEAKMNNQKYVEQDVSADG